MPLKLWIERRPDGTHATPGDLPLKEVPTPDLASGHGPLTRARAGEVPRRCDGTAARSPVEQVHITSGSLRRSGSPSPLGVRFAPAASFHDAAHPATARGRKGLYCWRP
ncbi:hypothetical protein DB31_9058 [Hyalangium minutum]|uniref:Uncharacterized protein n=1 Tax=Hyalangium minutum TaxID=394096 RepID=A0A085WGN1_9BACT|nr:hypothetical protein DB31_9058 [Hyalangium minutum]